MPIDVHDLIQNHTLAPVCRVHVYGTIADVEMTKPEGYRNAAVPPLPWCGPQDLKGNRQPHAILGKEPRLLLDAFGKQVGAPNIGVPIEWYVLSCRVNQTRQWDCSSANFQIAHPIRGEEEIHVPPIRPNDVIVIEMGYLPSPHSKMSQQGSANTDYSRFAGDIVFYGVVDTIVERAGAGGTDGIVFTVKARDQMRWLTDTKIRSPYAPGLMESYDRAFVIRDLLLLGSQIDTIQWKTNRTVTPFGMPAVERVPLRPAGNENMLLPALRQESNSYIRLGNIEKSSRKDAIKFEAGEHPKGMTIIDKFPIQVIKHFLLVENAPRELWADQRTGHIHCQNRRTDARRLFSSVEKISATRQYFYRFPAARANVMSYNAEWSVAGVVTHFTLTNPQNNFGTNAVKDLYAESPMAMLKDPHTGAYLRPMTRNRFAYDDTLNQADAPVGIVGALFHIWGRALTTGMVMVLGDPTLGIGEAVQLYNMGYFGRRHLSGGKNQDGGSATELIAGIYSDAEKNPEGVFRVEAVQHLFGVGGYKRGYVTVFATGPVDEDTGAAEVSGGPARFIKTDADYNKLFYPDPITKVHPLITNSEFPDGGITQ